MPHELRTARLVRFDQLSELTKHLEFETDLPVFDFAPGQFVSAVQKNDEGKTITRAYSIASEPRGDSTFALCINRVQDGFMSNFLCDLEPGATVQWHGAHGLFTLKPEPRESIFICTGTGVAPFRSMLNWIFEDPSRATAPQYTLVYGTRHADTIYYREEFEALAAANPKFKYVITLSRPDETWQGVKGYVQQHVLMMLEAREDRGIGSMQAYICGLNEMVSANRELLKSLGWDRKQISFERYD